MISKIFTRLLPLAFAVIFGGLLYFFVIDREALKEFVGVSNSATNPSSPEMVNTGEEGAQGRPSFVPPQASSNPTNVLVLKINEDRVDLSTSFSGTSEAPRFVDVRSQTSGLVISEPYRKGAIVAKDQILCELDPGTKQTQLEDALIRLESAELNAENTTKLAENGYATETDRIATQSALQSALTGVEAAKKELQRLKILAPFDGFLESDTAEFGSLLQPGSLCAKVIQINPMKIVGFVSQTEVGNLQVGDSSEVKFITGVETDGEISFISRQADADTKTFKVEITIANLDFSIREGFSAEVVVHAGSIPAHFIPQSSLTLNNLGELGVKVVEGNQVKFYKIEVIRDTLQGAWVSGLKQNVELIVVGQEFVVEGSEVEVTYREEVL